MHHASVILIWLLAILLGITVGAGLYEARVVLPLWADSHPPQWVNSGTRFWAYVSTGPLTLAVIAGLALVWKFGEPARTWWLLALGLSAVERAATFTYFIPTIIMLQQQPALSPEVIETLGRWSDLNNIRHLLALAAWLSVLKSLSLIGRSKPVS